MRTYRYISFWRNSAVSRKSPRRGAALVEFAMVAIVFFTMLLGMIQFGIYQSTANTLWNLSREGARFASVGRPTPTKEQIENHIKTAAPPNIDDNKLTVAVYPEPRTSGRPVEVNVTYDMSEKLFFPFFKELLQRERRFAPNEVRTEEVIVSGGDYFTSSTMRVE